MYNLLVKLMVLAALTQMGLGLAELKSYRSSRCEQTLKRAAVSILGVSWRPISVFPEEGRRFKERH